LKQTFTIIWERTIILICAFLFPMLKSLLSKKEKTIFCFKIPYLLEKGSWNMMEPIKWYSTLQDVVDAQTTPQRAHLWDHTGQVICMRRWKSCKYLIFHSSDKKDMIMYCYWCVCTKLPSVIWYIIYWRSRPGLGEVIFCQKYWWSNHAHAEFF